MKNLAYLQAARPITCALLLFTFFFTSDCFAQTDLPGNRISKKISEIKQKGNFTKEINLFTIPAQSTPDLEISGILKRYTLLDVHDIIEIQQSKPAYIRFSVPVENGGRLLKILLYKEDISPNGLTLLSNNGSTYPRQQEIVHYRGSIDDDLHSVAAFTFAGNEVSGFINNIEGNYVIGKTGNATGKHIVYLDKDLKTQTPFGCATNTLVPESPMPLARPDETAAIATKCVNWYWETDYDMFVNKGSVANVNAYMQSIFNQVATLYANDGITITLKTLFVWTAEDPYSGPTTSDYLNQFGAYRTSFNGDLAHLVGLKGSGGIAWINGLCKTSKYKMAYSGISSTYKTVPSFSWSVECITHEQGHLLGSRHTHDCAWNGNNTKIDGCGDAAGYSSGSCPAPTTLPAGGGTIMSYCHLTNAGINFNSGFGPQPAALMINTINAASCLVACISCTVPSQPGNITGNSAVCTATTQTYSVAAISGATSYAWSLPAGWTGSSITNSITVTTGAAGGNISITANNSCGNSTPQVLSVTSTLLPAQPGAVSGNTAVCAGTTQTYSIIAVTGATSYTWTLPSGWTGISTNNTISVMAGAAGGSLSVKANNGCGSSVAKTAELIITSVTPAQPTDISGNATVCAGSTQTFSVTAGAGTTSYTWTLPAGWAGSSATSSINAIAGSAGGNVSVSASNGCGTSAAKVLAVNTSPLPPIPGAITVSGGSATVCTGYTRTYTTPLVAGASYNWLEPSGSTITSGQGTNTIQLSFSSVFTSGSTLTVREVNGCGNGPSTGISISKKTISMPGSIGVSGGSSKICPGDIRTYTVASVTGITYNWTAPTGAIINTGQGTNSIIITYAPNFTATDTLRVTANNNCGSSSARKLTIRRNVLSLPGSISGSTTVCPNGLSTYFIAAVSGALSYIWALPPGATIQGASTGTSIQVLWGSTGGSVTVKAVNACGNSGARSRSVNISCIAGLEDRIAGLDAIAYPNPATDRITLKFNSADHSAYRINITDIVGRIMKSETRLAVAGINLYYFNVSEFSKGTYVISIQGKARKQLLKVNVE